MRNRDFLLNVVASLAAGGILWALSWSSKHLSTSFGRRRATLGTLLVALIVLLWLGGLVGSELLVPKITAWQARSFQITTTLVIFGLLLRELVEFWRIGLRSARATVTHGVSYKRALKLVKSNILFLGTGAAKLTGSDEFAAALLRCTPSREIKFLLLSPDHETLRTAAMRAGKGETQYRETVLRSLRAIAEVRKARNLRLSVRFYSHEQIWRLMFVDEHVCLASYNVFGEGDGSQLPQLLVTAANDAQREVISFFYAFRRYYDEVWSTAVDWDFEQYL